MAKEKYAFIDNSNIKREFEAFAGIDDVISTDKFNMSQNGIIHMNIIDWLLKDE